MSFFDKIYRREFLHARSIEGTWRELPFRYTDLLGGVVLGYSSQGEGKFQPGQRPQILLDAFYLGFYYLVANGYLTARVEYFRRTLLDSFDFSGSRFMLERNPDIPGFDELESPFLTAIYAAADGKRSLREIARQVADTYLGPFTRHDRPVIVFYSAMLSGEMRHWRVEREESNWGFTRCLRFACPEDHREILEEAGETGRNALRTVHDDTSGLKGVARVFAARFMLELKGRKRKEHRHYHYPRPPHRRHRRRRKRGPREPDDPRMWVG